MQIIVWKNGRPQDSSLADIADSLSNKDWKEVMVKEEGGDFRGYVKKDAQGRLVIVEGNDISSTGTAKASFQNKLKEFNN